MDRTSLNEVEAARFLGFKPSTLRSSRCTGVLGGRQPPRFCKLGRLVRYPLDELEAWLADVSVQHSTAEYRVARHNASGLAGLQGKNPS